MKTNSGFDFLAPVYDWLARFVFGKSIVDSQTWFLNKIHADSKVLIVGGGTGWLLEELQLHQPRCAVWYVEASAKMIKKAQHRKLHIPVQYLLGTEEIIPADMKFDAVITNFYLDLFSSESLSSVVFRISNHLTSRAIWLATDFVHGKKWWHSWLLRMMYLLFRLVCRIEGTQLPEWTLHLSNQNWKETDQKLWYSEFIKSSVWIRA